MQMMQVSLDFGRTRRGLLDSGEEWRILIFSSFLEFYLGLLTESCELLTSSREEALNLLMLCYFILYKVSLASKTYGDVIEQQKAFYQMMNTSKVNLTNSVTEKKNKKLAEDGTFLLSYLVVCAISNKMAALSEKLVSHKLVKYFYPIMGAGQSLNERAMHYGVQELNEQCWDRTDSILKRTSSTAKLHMVAEECKPIATYFSAQHAFRIDEYLLDSAEISNVDEYLGEIQWRNQCQYLVNVKYIKGFTSSFICDTGTPKSHIYIEHIPLRLSQITDIPFPDNLYLLKACLKGFYYIFLHVHVLDIKEDHICLTEEGKVKIWMNSNLAKNTPSLTNIFKTGKKSELMIVREIINVVDENTDHQFQPKNFKQFLRDNRLQNLTFSEAILAVEQFSAALRIAIPSNLESVHDLFDPLYISNRTINSIHDSNPIYNSYEVGRGAETSETKMLESIPFQEQHENSTFIDGFNRSPQLIKHLENYDCKANTHTSSSLPFQGIQYPLKVNFIIRNPENRMEKVTNSVQYTRQSSSNLIPQTQNYHASEDDWRYYDVNGWLDIDPEILKDLKDIQQFS